MEKQMSKCQCGKWFTPGSRGQSSKMCTSCVTNRRRFDIKLKAIEYLGGKCLDCGYAKCVQALEFDHIDPTQKEFSLSGKHCLSWDKIKAELDKCELRCANCHRERHARDRKPLEYKIEEHLTTTICLICDKQFTHIKSDNRKYCSKICSNKAGRQHKINWPSVDELIQMIDKSSFVAVSDVIGVSDNAIRKYLARHGVDPKSIRSIKNNKFIKRTS